MTRPSRRQALLSGLGLTAVAILADGAENSVANSKGMLSDSRDKPSAAQRLWEAYSLPEIEALARDSMVPSTYQWMSAGAADEITLRWNREALERLRLQTRVLVDVSVLDTRSKLLGHELPFPILLAPTGGQGVMHPEGELATVRGAGASSAFAMAGGGTDKTSSRAVSGRCV